MITRPASRSHICLSCRRSLAKRKLPAAYQFARQLSTLNTEQDSSEPRDETPSKNNGDFVRKDFESSPKLPMQSIPARPLGRLHGHRGVKSREDLENLQTTSLGEEASVIVLRDSGISMYERRIKIEDKQAEHIDILGQLADERGLVGKNDVNSNIDGLKPQKGEEPEDWNDINDLVKQLQDGFTITQLERYIENFEGKRQPINPPEEWISETETASILAITPWQPGVSDIKDHFDNDPLRGYFLESHTAKQRVILRLLRECWMVELPELEEGLGQFEMKINLDDLVVLLMGDRSVLSGLHNKHLILEGENLEAFPSRSVIRVTTTHAKKNFIVEAVEEAVKNIEKRKLALGDLYPASLGTPTTSRLKSWAKKYFDDEVLQELSRTSNSSISRKSKHRLLISSIAGANISGIDIATRYLLTAGNFSDRVEYELATITPDSGTGALIPYPLIKGLPWRERLRNWSRWTSPIAQKDLLPLESNLDSNKGPPTTILTIPTKPREKLKPGRTKKAKPLGPEDEKTYWSSDRFTDTSVLFGSILHSPLQPMSNPVSAKMLATATVAHTFSSHVPNISRLLSKAKTKEDEEFWTRGSPMVEKYVRERLVMHFQPNPFYKPPTAKGQVMRGTLGPAALLAFPPIEMFCNIEDDADKSVTLKYIQAVIHESKKDIMLPGSAVDLRFQRRTTTRLKRRYINQVEEFLKKCNLNLKGQKRLAIPPSIIIPISSTICRDPGFKVLGDKASKPSSEVGEDIRDVEYLYTGLEIRRTRAFDYQGWPLLYTSYEAGKAGGARGELKLRPKQDVGMASEEDLTQFAYQVARFITEGGEGEDKGMFELPSLRKIQTRDTRKLGDKRSPPLLVRQVTSESPEGWHFGDKYVVHRPSRDEYKSTESEPKSKKETKERNSGMGDGSEKRDDR